MPDRYCGCNCGTPVKPGQRFVRGHNSRVRPPKTDRWLSEDRGYETPCWVWQMAIQRSSGYGLSGIPGHGSRAYLAHRVIYEQHHGALPDGLQLDHLCRVRACVNPDHLEPVTAAENCRRGNQAKLTAQQVAAIRAQPERSIRSLAAEYGVGSSTISDIQLRKSWR